MSQGINSLTPKEIVAELDKYIIGQDEAKKMVAIALRNRWRRQNLPPDIRDEVAPKNIIMIGPTGVGKTEIARRLARLAQSPFIKVEATKYTEVGYVGRDVESMIRDLVDMAVSMVKSEKSLANQEKAVTFAEERLLDLLLPPASSSPEGNGDKDSEEGLQGSKRATREKLRKMLEKGEMDERYLEVEVKESSPLPIFQIFSSTGLEEMDMNLRQFFDKLMPQKKKKRKAKVKEVRQLFIHEEAEKLIDMDEVVSEALQRVETHGIIFLDEIDKIASRGWKGVGPDVSREGVQRDILPIIEGCTVATKYGIVKTDHILFIAAGAFHASKPSDLIPELQGRFPLRVELKSLTAEDFRKILIEPKNALLKQYIALLQTEGMEVSLTDEAIWEVAQSAYVVNQQTEDIGARRLHTILERVFEDISFSANDQRGSQVVIDANYIRARLKEIMENRDLSRYIL